MVGVAVHNLAFQDVVALAFHTYMWLRISVAPVSHDQIIGQRFAVTLLTVTTCTILLTRGEVLKAGPIRSWLYRLGMFAPVVLSYFEMRFLLTGIQPVLMDHELYAFDRALLGETPAVWLARFNTPAVIEWFGFFYYGYFFLMGAMLIPTAIFDKGKRQIELLVGAVIVGCVGHSLYTLVPGAGPHATIEFAEPIHGGFFWQQILDTISRGGAFLDIFPSLHTAYPVLYALHAYGNRDSKPFNKLWPLIAIFAAHMVVATLLLRWHWFVDVLAGLALAVAARQIGVFVAKREIVRDGPDDERQPIWERPLF